MARSCDECTLCCKLVGVSEIEKPPRQWCQHCNIGEGCAIYDTRPESCKRFECFWYSNEWIPNSLRPDRCHFVMEGMQEANAVLVILDPDYPQAWRHGEAMKLFNQLMKVGISSVVSVSGNRQPEALLLAPGVTPEHIMRGMEAAGNANIQRYADQEGITFEEAVRQIDANRAQIEN